MPPARPYVPRAFEALGERDFALFYAGLGLSLVGMWMERAALSWLVYRLTGDSETWLGLAAGVPLIPSLLLSIPAGALIDRARVRSVLLCTQTLMCVGAAGIAALVLSGHVEPWHILAYAAYAASVFAVDAPARHAFVVRIVGRARITNAFALNAVLFQVARVLGFALFGVILESTSLGEGGCLALNTVSFACVLVSLFLIRERPVETAADVSGTHPLEGLRYAVRTPVVRAALLISVTTVLLGYQVSSLFPVYAKKVWGEGSEGFAFLSGALGIGALLGGLLLATRSRTVVRGALIRRIGFAGPVLLAAFAATALAAPDAGGPWSYRVGIGLAGVTGFAMIQLHASCSSLLQSVAPDDLRGRISSLFTLTVLASFPLGGLLAGLAADVVGAPVTTLVAATLLAISHAVIHATHPDLRHAA